MTFSIIKEPFKSSLGDVFKNKFAEDIFKQKYQHDGAKTWPELVDTLVEEVCTDYLSKNDKWQLKAYMRDMKFIPGGRYLYYAGRTKKYYNNCYLLNCLEDTREDWADLSWKAERCLTVGGGIGSDYSIYRPRNSYLHGTGGVASGPVSKMRMINEIGREVIQGGSRRSAIYASLNWKHNDIQEFLHAKDWGKLKIAGTDKTYADVRKEDFNFPCPLDMTNISINYDTKWILDYWSKGQLSDIFLANCKQAMMTGEPGFSFNLFEKEKETLRNAPVSKDTWVYTSTGYRQIKDIVDTPIVLWTGKQWAITKFSKTRTKDDVVKVTFTGKRYIICSRDHPFVTINQDRIEAQNLETNTPLFASTPSQIGGKEVLNAYLLAFLYGDGTFHTRYPRAEVTLCGEKEKLLDRLVSLDCTITRDKRNLLRIYYNNHDLLRARTKEIFPEEVYSWDANSRNDFLSGLIDADGGISGNYISIGSIHRSFLEGVARLADSLGFQAYINIGSKSGYTGNPTWTLKLSGKLSMLNTNRVLSKDTELTNYKIVSVENWGKEDVYCCDVGVNEHSFMAEGVIISNCTEVTSEDDSDVCNLGSLNLARITTIEELKDVIELATKFLLCGTFVAQLPYDKVAETRRKNRRLGLGLMGVHEFLLQRGGQYEVSQELHRWLAVYASVSRDVANSFSKLLNCSAPVACRAVAPTGSIGILASTTTGIEPVYAVAIKRRYLKGAVWKYQYVVDEIAKTFIEQYSVDPTSLESSVDLAKEPEKRIKFQAKVQDFVDMAISSTINLPAWGTEWNNEDRVKSFADTLAKYSHRLRGFTVYPDGARGGQPLVSVPYEEAIDKLGIELEENLEHFDSCDIQGRGYCGL